LSRRTTQPAVMGRAAASSVRVRWRRGPVSAVSASPAAKGSPAVSGDPVRALQHALYRAAKADPGRRFHALHDKVRRRDVLWRAWVMVRSNNGAPGTGKITLAAVEEYGVTRLLDELASELEEGRYRPHACAEGLYPQAGRAGRAEAAFHPSGSRPYRAGCCEDRARAGLRGGFPAVQLRVPAQAVGARRAGRAVRPRPHWSG
jgi:hypothetical protein